MEERGSGSGGGGPGFTGWAGALLFVSFGVLVFGLRALDADRPQRPAEWLGGAAMAVFYALPGVLAVLSRWRGPGLLAAGAALGFLSIPTSMSITPLLLVPSTLLAVAYVQRRWPARPRVPTAVLVLVTLVLGAAAFLSLLVHPDPYCWSYTEDASGRRTYRAEPVPGPTDQGGFHQSAPPRGSVVATGSGCSSDTVTGPEATLSLALSASAVVAAAVLGGPKTASGRRRSARQAGVPGPLLGQHE